MSAFHEILEYFALIGLGICSAMLVWFYLAHLSKRASSFARRYSIIGLLAAAFFGFAAITEGPPDEEYKDAAREELVGEGETNALYGAMLTIPRRTSSARSPAAAMTHRLVYVVTNEVYDYTMPANATEYAPWRLRGAAEDWFKLDFGNWRFPMGTNDYSTLRVFANGTIRPKLHSTNDAISAIGAAMSAIPDVSRFWYSVGTNYSRILTWENFVIGRIPTNVCDLTDYEISAQIELFPSGDYIVRSNNVERLYRYIDPFDCPASSWGQSDAARAQIDAIVGTNLENGYYKLTVTVPQSVGRRTLITVGSQQLVADKPGEYAFLLEKGEEYQLSLEPFSPAITYEAVDDIRPPLMGGKGTSVGVWTKDLGWHKIVIPERFFPGWCYWTPKFSGSPDVSFVGIDDDVEFRAVLSDCPHYRTVTYEWTCEDGNIHIESPHSERTRISFFEMPRWASSSLKVTATLGTNTLESVLDFNYGREEYPRPICSMSAPEVVFVNDDSRTSRYYRVELTLDAPLSANAQVALSDRGGVTTSFFSDEIGKHPIPNKSLTIEPNEENPIASRTFFISCDEIGSGTLNAAFTIEGEGTEIISHNFVVIEPLRKLVCTEETQDGGYYNPSRLVAGSHAWLKVGVNGDYNEDDVEWRIVSGPGKIESHSGFIAKVVPTATSGEVVVEAAFGHDSMIQPQFVLPIVEEREIPIKVFIVAKNHVPVITESQVDLMIQYANRIYSQVGICFVNAGITNYVGMESDCEMSGFDIRTNNNGRVVKVLSQQAQNLLNVYTERDCIEVYFVEKITRCRAVAFCTQQGIIARSNISRHTLAHEIGHALGLRDCYTHRKRTLLNDVVISGGNLPVTLGSFGDRHSDWGEECGRAFYEISDTHIKVMYDLLMYGVDGKLSVDIPDGTVYSLKKNAKSDLHAVYQEVGAKYIKQDNREVFSR